MDTKLIASSPSSKSVLLSRLLPTSPQAASLSHLRSPSPTFLPPSHRSRAQSALGMEPNQPPPYLANMQRYGAPPSYPNLKIPGLNAPLPEGASWGFQPGGWGKEPTDLVCSFSFFSFFFSFVVVLLLLFNI